MQVYTFLDLIQNELRNARIQNLGAAPGTPVEGQIYYDSGTHTLYYWNGTAWIAASAAAGGPPTGAAGGDLSGTYPNPVVNKSSLAAGFTTAGSITVGLGTVGGNRALYLTDTSGAGPGLPLYNNGGGNLRMDAGLILLPQSGVSLSAGNGRLSNVLDPTAAQDAATKNYVDGLVNGLSWKDTCRAGTTANIALTGTQTIDGVAVVAGNRVLVKNQTTASQNGIYVVAAGAWARATDANSEATLLNAAAFISEGTTLADTAWVMTTNAPITVDTTALTWAQFGAGATYTAGTGLILAGNQFSIDTAVVVQTSRSILTTAPLTGGGNLTADRTLGITSFAGSAPGAVPTSPGGTTQFLRADGTWAAPAAPAGMVSKFAAALTGTVAYATGEVVTHNLNTRDVQVAVVNSNSPYQRIECDWEATTVNTVTIRYSPNIGAGFRAVVMA